ncbi:MAG: mannitol-1-phosphate 5-dehydrogenase [Alicyclobacillus sp.]|nr:mannitol-1-phosphate 5-dehydrogenase [Alicyclobacillus sp.]
MSRAVHFGAGNIGRGFIGEVLVENGYDVLFADVVPTLVDALAAQSAYRVITLDAEIEVKTVRGVSAVLLDSEPCREAVAEADLVTTAVGVANLASVAAVIADGLTRRMARGVASALNVIACENAVRASSILREMVWSLVQPEVRMWMEAHVGFPDAAVDRIAPNRDGHATEPLDAVVERHFEWDIERPAVRGELQLKGVTFVDNLEPYLERKLYLVNGAHAAAAYAGYRRGRQTVIEAMGDATIRRLVEAVQTEAVLGLSHAYPELTAAALHQYAQTVRERFGNPHVVDSVDRVGRDPLRKLGGTDRLFGPLQLARAAGASTPGLVRAIACALAYDNPRDPTAVELQTRISAGGVRHAAAEISGCTDDAVLDAIAADYERVVGGDWRLFAD